MSSVKITYIQYCLPEATRAAKLARRDALAAEIQKLSGFLVQRPPAVLNNLHNMQEELATLNAELAAY